MAFNVGIGTRDAFGELKKLAPRQRLDAVRAQPDAATYLTMLTPAQFAELFPDYYKRGLPDVSGFREAISRKSRQKQDDINFGLSQGAKSVEEAEKMGGWRRRFGGGKEGAEGVTTSSEVVSKRISSPVMAKEIYNYLRSKNVDHVHAMGILANIQGESGFNAGIMPSAETQRREGGPSGGLFQHHDNPSRGEFRFSDMVKAAGGPGVWQKNWKGQVDFALSEPQMKKYLSLKFDNEKEAVMGFIEKFERPKNPEADYVKRVGFLKSIDTAVTATGSSPGTSGPDVSKTTSGGGFEVTKGGFVVPKDKSLYDSGNTEQCATLGKAFNPSIGRSKGWSVVKGDIKPGMTVATMQYNNPGADRTHAGYHTGVAMTAPDENGNFLLLEQYSGRPAQIRQVNAFKYSAGSAGGFTQFGIISSNGKLHTEQSAEALQFGASLAGGEMRSAILANYNSLSSGGGQTVTGAASAEAPTATAKAAQTTQTPQQLPQAPVGPPVEQVPQQASERQKQQLQQQTQTAEVNKPLTSNTQRQEAEKAAAQQSASLSARYKVNSAEFRKMAEKENFLAAAASDERIRTGFNDDERVKAAGAYIDEKWVLHFKDKNNPVVKEVMSGMDTSGVLTPIKEKGTETGSEKPKTGEGMGDAETATVKRGPKTKVKSAEQEQAREINKQHLLQAMNEHNVLDPNKRAAMAAVVQGESGFMPRSETEYTKTSNDSIRKKFSVTRRMSDAQLNALKKSPEAFFNKVYGGKLGNAPDEGYKYRGRGMVQLTGKLNYAKYGEKIGMKDELLNNPDLANRPDIAAKLAVAYMEDRTRKRGRDIYTKVARGVGNPVAATEKVKKAAYQQFAQSGEFAPGKKAVLPEQPTQFAEATPSTTRTQQQPGVTTPTFATTPTDVAKMEPTKKGVFERAKEFAQTSLVGEKATAAPVKPQTTTPPSVEATPTTPMMTKPQPAPQVDITPMSKVGIPAAGNIQSKEMRDMLNTMQDMTTHIQQPAQPAPAQPKIDRSETPQKPVIIDTFLNQRTTGFPTPSLERAMAKARGYESDSSPNRVGSGTSLA